MTFLEMEKGFQYAFSAALRAYRRGSTAIGCAIMNSDGECISLGENSIYANDDMEKINRHHLAHAEINAILKVGSGHYGVDHKNNILYTTMEPCIMCFGAIVMCYYKHVKFAAPDPIGGATNIKEQNRYNLSVEGPFEGLAELQVALAIYRSLALNLSHIQRMIDQYEGICTKGVLLGETLHRDTAFGDMIDGRAVVADEKLFNYMFAQLGR